MAPDTVTNRNGAPDTVYGPAKPALPRSIEQLRSEIPGWGADLDPAVRPAVPRERFDPEATGAHWSVPERQPEHQPRERSIEHRQLTPAFGTAQPLKGASGAIRRFAYARYGEGRAAHWLLLLAADRVDAVESHMASFATGRPDNPWSQSGIGSEISKNGLAARTHSRRADRVHHALDPLIIFGPWVAAGAATVKVVRRVVRTVS